MFKSKLGLVIAVLCVLTLVLGGCGSSSGQETTATSGPKTTATSAEKMTVKVIQIQARAMAGQYLDVVFQVSGDQPCKLVLEKRQDSEFDNYFYPDGNTPAVTPESDGKLSFHQMVPETTVSGSYILQLYQVTPDGGDILIYKLDGFIVQYQELN